MARPKVYIFGDSFFSFNRHHASAWPTKLEQNYKTVFASKGGASNHDIYLSFMSYVDIITPADSIILGWSDAGRYYVRPEVEQTPELGEIHYHNFFNKTLDTLYQRTYMKEIKRICEEKNFHIQVWWSFPSDYIAEKSNFNWLDSILDDYHFSNYTYLESFANEVRPALIYFSKDEATQCKTSNKVIHFFRNDSRPNHIGEQRIHDEIFQVMREFVDTKNTGTVDLYKRLNNGR